MIVQLSLLLLESLVSIQCCTVHHTVTVISITDKPCTVYYTLCTYYLLWNCVSVSAICSVFKHTETTVLDTCKSLPYRTGVPTPPPSPLLIILANKKIIAFGIKIAAK